MPKITFIGAGSFGFTRTLVRDLLTFPLLEGSQITLMDIHADRLEWSRRAVQRIVDEGHYPATVVTTLDRVEALRGADYVIVTILAGATEVWRHDIEIPARYGVDMNVGDTRSVSGIFRALRTIPVMVDIARDMERLCPRALLLNYTNPMAMLCRAIDRTTSIAVTGLCHSVQGTAEMLARWIGAPMNEISYTCAGINHMAWYLRYEWNGQDAYPLIRKAITEQPEVYNEEQVRNEMFLAFDHYVTESSGHNSEYSWWFRKRPDIINALEGGEPFTFNGNMPNHNLVDNLPQNACVEIPVWASRKGLEAVAVGALPPQCAMLTHLSAQIEEMAVEAALTGNRRLVYQAVANDPLSAAVLSLAEIQQMVDELFAVNQPHLPQF